MYAAAPLALALALSLPLAAQVGVNEPDPEQALDVGGKVRIADDDTPPSAGTLRYNTDARRFEGHDGRSWSPLTNVPHVPDASGGGVPAGAIPVYGKTVGIVADDDTRDATLYYGDGSGTFTVVPANTYLIVTWVNVRDNDVNPTDARVLGRVGPRASATASIRSSAGMYLHSSFPDNVTASGSLAPLITVGPGDRLAASNSRFSEDVIEVEVRGFLVPSLSY